METIEISNFTDLPFGENTHQVAAIAKIEEGIDYEILSENKDLTYIDFLNLTSAVKILAEFFDVDGVVISKESSICSVALGANLNTALEKALDCDPISAFQGTIGFTKEVNLDIAKQIEAVRIKNVVAPRFTTDALSYLFKNNDINKENKIWLT